MPENPSNAQARHIRSPRVGPSSSTGELKPLHYDPWLTPLGPLEVLSQQVFQSLPLPPITPGRKHRADAIARRMACLKSILANLAMFHLFPSPYAGLAVPLMNSKRTRYDRAGFTADVLRSCIADLQAGGLVEIVPGEFRQRRTLLIPRATLRTQMEEQGIRLSDIGREDGKETVQLWTRRQGNRAKELVEYADTPETESMRENMEAINTALNASSIRYDGVPLPPRHLVRMFTRSQASGPPTFDLHGRLYGGFWQSLHKGLRYKLTVDGEELVDLDFKGMFLQLAYAHVGSQMPLGDPYAVPGLEGHRDTVKKLTVSLFFRDGMAARFPQSVEKLPAGWTMRRFVEALSARHAAIAPLFGSDIGFRMMFAESEILIAVLLELASRGITALPQHDGFMVAKTHRSVAMAVMEEVSKAKLGRALPVVEKPILRPA